jgi:hypothetical protein
MTTPSARAVFAVTEEGGHVAQRAFRKGDKVAWNTPQGRTTGRVVERVTGERTVANDGQRGQKVKGSEDDPRYVVESDSTGKRAAHRADALERL